MKSSVLLCPVKSIGTVERCLACEAEEGSPPVECCLACEAEGSPPVERRSLPRMKRWLHSGTIALLAACSCATFSTGQDARLNKEDARLNRVYQQRVAQVRSDPA